jgi:hypothetical protein
MMVYSRRGERIRFVEHTKWLCKMECDSTYWIQIVFHQVKTISRLTRITKVVSV